MTVGTSFWLFFEMLGKWTVFAVKEPDDRWMDGRCLKMVYFLKLMDFGVGGNELLGMDAPKNGFVKTL